MVTRPVLALIVTAVEYREASEYTTDVPSGSLAVNWIVPPALGIAAVLGAAKNTGALFPVAVMLLFRRPP
jgi:hypothetical protein